MQHDVGITATRTVLLDAPLVFDLTRVMEGGLPFGFEGDQTARIGVMPRFGEGAGRVWIDTGELQLLLPRRELLRREQPRRRRRVQGGRDERAGNGEGVRGGRQVRRRRELSTRTPLHERLRIRGWYPNHPNVGHGGRRSCGAGSWTLIEELVSSERMCAQPAIAASTRERWDSTIFVTRWR